MPSTYEETVAFGQLQSSSNVSSLPSWDIHSSYHPLDRELALLANHVYNPNNSLPLSSDWIMLAKASAENGYNGVAYWHTKKRQVVISHCGTEPPLPASVSPEVSTPAWWNLFGKMYQYVDSKVQGVKEGIERITPTIKDLLTDYSGVAQGREVEQIESALEFSGKVLAKLSNIPVLSISVTGHSLGGWLAQLTAYEFRRGFINQGINRSIDLHCVVFDSPGARQILEISEAHATEDHKLDLKTELDITTYLSAPNLVNTCNGHLGTVYRIFPNLPQGVSSNLTDWMAYLLQAHTMDNFHKLFNASEAGFPVQLKKVVKWPQIDWTKMEISKLSTVHSLWRLFTGRSTGIDAFFAALANLDHTQFEAIAEICRVNIETEECTFEQRYNMTRKGKYEIKALSTNNVLYLPLRAFGSHHSNIITGLYAYRTLMQANLLLRNDINSLNNFKTALSQKFSGNTFKLFELAGCLSVDENPQVLKLDIASCIRVFNLTLDEANSPEWLRYLEFQFVQVARYLFVVYPGLAMDLHQAYLGIPSQLLDSNLELKKALETLENKMDEIQSVKQEGRDYRIDSNKEIRGKVGRAGLRAGNVSGLVHDKEAFAHATAHIQTMTDKGMRHKVVVTETGVVDSLEDEIGNIDFSQLGNQATKAQQALSEQASILSQLGLFSPRDESINVVLFLIKAKEYHASLSEENNDYIVAMSAGLKELIDTCPINGKGVTKAQRDEIRNLIKQIDEVKAAICKPR
jgi:hypothetical protein